MPIYEYQCTECGEVFEAFQKINDEPVTKCRFCGGSVEKLFSHTSFQLKGSGWYLTDYSRKSQPTDTGSGSSKESSKPSDSKADSGGGTTSSTPSTPSPAKPSETKT